ncbi:phosphatase PAP2 family protein [Paenibacillus aurantiacus]|uniref:Phosphatase PAP2 family protein n=1 Tax=Paenibacillus aurantiacus TaxID=1936118 RepID=A0ABV5KJ29_9BACL
MQTMVAWLRGREHALLAWANRRPINRMTERVLGGWLGTITHMGGASFTLISALLVACLAPAPWGAAGAQSLAAVALSHLPVALVKRKFRRLRPYQKLPHLHCSAKPLQDPSFPSGHTTAITAWLAPWLMAYASLLPALLPAALLICLSVAWSRMYLGLHYPSDVMAGAVLGSSTAVLVSSLWSFF